MIQSSFCERFMPFGERWPEAFACGQRAEHFLWPGPRPSPPATEKRSTLPVIFHDGICHKVLTKV